MTLLLMMLKLLAEHLYVTTLSNFGLAFDAYARAYDKSRLPRTNFPDRVFVLRHEALAAGISEATGLLAARGLPGDSIVAIEAHLARGVVDILQPAETGVGQFSFWNATAGCACLPLGDTPESAFRRCCSHFKRG